MNARDLKNHVERTVHDVREELEKNDLFGRLTPIWLILGGLVLLAWIASGVPVALLGFVSVVAVGAIVLGPPAWVLTDARKRGVKHPLGWGVFSLLTTPVGALIYYLVRPNHVVQKSCGSCGEQVSTSFAACPFCGVEQAAAGKSCPACRADVEVAWRFCPYCRHSMEATG